MLRRLVDMTPAAVGLAVPAGDDAASWLVGSRLALISTDSMVEGVHFRRAYQSPYEVGLKAWAQAASDIAAMGGRVEVGVVAAVMPRDTPWQAVEAIQLGLLEGAQRDGAGVVGGDLSSGPQIVLVVTVAGSITGDRPVQLAGSQPGDQLVVTGQLGGAAAALLMLDGGEGSIAADWLRALRRPRARLVEGALLRRSGASAMTDLSDGLLLDCHRLAGASGVGAELWANRVPLAGGLGSMLGQDAVRLGMTGGEDYELLAAIPPAALELAMSTWPEDIAPITHVGRLVVGATVRLLADVDGPEIRMEGWNGYQHY